MLHQYGTPFQNLRYRHWNEFRDLILNLCSVINPHIPTRIASIDLICFLYHTDEIYQTCVSYTNLFKILAHYLQTVYILEMTSDVLDNLNHQIFQYHDVKLSNLENFILTRVVYSWNKLPESVKSASTLLGFKKSLTTYFNDILESNFNVNNTCTWVHVCKCALCRQCS